MTVGRDPRDLLEEMIEELQYLEERVGPLDVEDFVEDRTLRRAVERSLEILGEAAKGLPESVVHDHPQVPWSDMAKMRDVLIHAYHRVDPVIVWKAVVEHALPVLPALQDVLAGIDAVMGNGDD